MAPERSGWRELTQFVAHHLFRNENWDVFPTIVNSYGMANHNRNNHRGT
jgi:hypothetical protein